MSWHLEKNLKKGKLYYMYTHSYREKGKVKNKRVHLGPEKRAIKILADFNSKKPDRKQCYSYTGELLLKEVAKRLKFSEIVDKHVQKDTAWAPGNFLQTVVIERCLFPYSKWALAQRIHKESIFALQNCIPVKAFSETNIYRYMDYIQPFIHSIQSDLVERVYKLFPAKDEVLILDGTSLYTYGTDSEPTSEEEEEEGGSTDVQGSSSELEEGLRTKHVARVHGYSRSKRPDLAQVNVMLGVNQRQIPLYFDVFAGNTVDLAMFEYTLQQLKTHYQGLLRRMKKRYIIFDRGNVSDKTIRQVDRLCDKWRFDFIAGIKKDLVKEELNAVADDQLPVIFSQKKTELYGRVIEKTVYDRPRKVLLYLSKAVRKHNLLEFQANLDEVQTLLAAVDVQEQLSPSKKVHEMEVILRSRSMLRLFFLKKFAKDGTPEPEPTSALYQLLHKKVEAKKNRLGQKYGKFQRKLEEVQVLLAKTNLREQLSPVEKIEEMKIILREHSMVRLFWFKKFAADGTAIIPGEGPSILYRLLPKKVEAKKALFGKFAVLSSDLNLTAPEMIRLYKTKEVVEHEFHLLKDLLKMDPFRHWLPDRIDVHVAVVTWGMLFLSVLKNLLEQNGFSYSFEELLRVIKRGSLEKVTFLYPGHKNFLLTRETNIPSELERIFRSMKIKLQFFHIEEFRLQINTRKSKKSG